MKTKRLLLLTLILAQTMMMYAQTNPVFRYLPENASMVMSFNPVKLANKVPGETFRQSFIYKEITKKDSDEVKAFLSDPSISGINFSNDIVLAVVKDTAGGKESTYTIVMGSLKNEPLFSTNIKKLSKSDKDSVRVYGTNKMLLPENAGMAMAWNNEVFVLVMPGKNGMREDYSAIFSDTTDTRSFDVKIREIMEKLQRSQRNLCFELLTPKNQSSLLSNTYFTEAMNAEGDIRAWNNGDGLASRLSKLPPQFSGLFNKLAAMNKTNRATIVNFENGKIKGTNYNYISPETGAIWQKYPSPAIDPQLASRLPKDATPIALAFVSMNKGLSKEMMQRSGFTDILDSLKGKLPFDMSLLTSSFKNEMMMAVINTPILNEDVDEEMSQSSRMMKGLDIIVAMPISDKDKFDQLRSAVSRLVDSMSKEGKGQKIFGSMKPGIRFNNDLFVFTLQEKTADAFINNPGTSPLPGWISEYKDYPMLMSFNFKELMTLTMGSKFQALDNQERTLIDMFDKMVFTGGRYENGRLQSTVEFRFSNSSDNAMKQLFQMMNLAAESKQKDEREYIIEKGDPPPQEEMKVPAPGDKNAPKIVSDQKVEILEIKQEGESVPPPPPPPPPPPKKKTTVIKKTKG